MDTARIVLTTCATKEQARTIAHALLTKRLIACATMLPEAHSLYHWEGKIADESEVVLFLKTTVARVGDLEKQLVALHPYRVAEFLVLTPVQVGEAYGKWLTAEVLGV